jgi:predicted signal transduction protein with EAL and GGDEF domain
LHIGRVVLKDELLEAGTASVHMHLVVAVNLSGSLLEISAVELRTALKNFVLNAALSNFRLDIQVDELVGNDLQLLE